MKFAITYFSPIHPEMEICRRIEIAAKNLGHECYFINPEGIALQNGRPISELNIEFLLVFDPSHFTLHDVFMYHMLWFVPGLVSTQSALLYDPLSRNCDDHLGFPSPAAQKYYKQFYKTNNDNYLFPSVPKNYLLKPQKKTGVGKDQYKAFYAGINVDSKTVRHEEIFKYLDSQGLIDLYGPKRINGKENWVGFKSFRGSIPFDGHSIMKTANASGITLALHHEAHASFSMPTNRLFEGIAAGTLVITDRMQFVMENFEDSVFVLDFNLSKIEKAKQIEQIINWANKNPEEAREKIAKAQEIFLEKFELTKNLGVICDQHKKREKELLVHSLSLCNKKTVGILLEAYDLLGLQEGIVNIAKQDYPHVVPYLLMFFRPTTEEKKIIASILKQIERFQPLVVDAFVDRKSAEQKSFNITIFVREKVKEDFIIFCEAKQFWHKNHVRSLVESIVLNKGEIAYSGSYLVDDGKTFPIVFDCVKDLKRKIVNATLSESDPHYQRFHFDFLKSAVIIKTCVFREFQVDCVPFIYFYEHLVAIVACFLKRKKICFSEKLTVYLKKRPNFFNPEFEIYPSNPRLSQGMSVNSLQFILNIVFAKDMEFQVLKEMREESIRNNWQIHSQEYLDMPSFNRYKRRQKRKTKLILLFCAIVLIASYFFN